MDLARSFKLVPLLLGSLVWTGSLVGCAAGRALDEDALVDGGSSSSGGSSGGARWSSGGGGGSSSSSGGSSGGGSSSGSSSSGGGSSSGSSGSSSGGVPAGTSLTIVGSVGGEAAVRVVEPTTSELLAVPRGTLPGCPATLSPSVSQPAEWLELRNPTARAVTVEVRVAASSYDLYVLAYSALPSGDAARRACSVGRNCFDGRPCLDGERAVRVEPNASAYLYVTPVGSASWPTELTVSSHTLTVD